MRNLLGRLIARNRVFVLACALVLGGFQFLMCAVVAELDLENALGRMLAFVPPVVRAAFEQLMPGGSAQAVLAFGWDHPITHALLGAVAIALAARAVAGEAESGVLELVLAQPLGRLHYLGAHVCFGLLALAVALAAGALGTTLGVRVFGLPPFLPGRFPLLLLDLFLLQAALYGVTLLFSAWGREGGRVALGGVLVAVLSYLANVLATFLPRAGFLEPWSLHGYYDPRSILVLGKVEPGALVVLPAVIILATSLAAWRFRTRDLP